MKKTMTIPSQDLVTDVVEMALDFQMSAPLAMTSRSTDARGKSLPQSVLPLHGLDITAGVIPLSVNRWQLETADGRLVNLCLAGSTRTSSGDPEMDLLLMPATSVVAIFQICDHSEGWPCQQKGPTRNIGRKDKETPKIGVLSYMTLIFERGGVGVCTLLSPRHIDGDKVVLMVNPNRIEREFPLLYQD